MSKRITCALKVIGFLCAWAVIAYVGYQLSRIIPDKIQVAGGVALVLLGFLLWIIYGLKSLCKRATRQDFPHDFLLAFALIGIGLGIVLLLLARWRQGNKGVVPPPATLVSPTTQPEHDP